MRRRPMQERFWEKVDTSGECWIWTAGTDVKGYGRIGTGDGNRMAPAHRYSFELANGPVADGFIGRPHVPQQEVRSPGALAGADQQARTARTRVARRATASPACAACSGQQTAGSGALWCATTTDS